MSIKINVNAVIENSDGSNCESNYESSCGSNCGITVVEYDPLDDAVITPVTAADLVPINGSSLDVENSKITAATPFLLTDCIVPTDTNGGTATQDIPIVLVKLEDANNCSFAIDGTNCSDFYELFIVPKSTDATTINFNIIEHLRSKLYSDSEYSLSVSVIHMKKWMDNIYYPNNAVIVNGVKTTWGTKVFSYRHLLKIEEIRVQLNMTKEEVLPILLQLNLIQLVN